MFAHLLIFGLCVALPTVVMLIMPVASTHFIRSNGIVSATAVRKVFFVIPYRTETVAHVTSVDDHFQPGTVSKTSRSGPVNDPMRPVTRTEDMSQLVIHGRDATVEVPVSPADIDDVRRKVRDYLEDAAEPELRLFTVANWKISVVTAGVLSLLTLIYAACMIWGLFSKVFRKRGA